MIEENNSLSIRIQSLEKERLESDASVSKLKEAVAGQNSQISDLLAEVGDAFVWLARLCDLTNLLSGGCRNGIAEDAAATRGRKVRVEVN